MRWTRGWPQTWWPELAHLDCHCLLLHHHQDHVGEGEHDDRSPTLQTVEDDYQDQSCLDILPRRLSLLHNHRRWCCHWRLWRQLRLLCSGFYICFNPSRPLANFPAVFFKICHGTQLQGGNCKKGGVKFWAHISGRNERFGTICRNPCPCMESPPPTQQMKIQVQISWVEQSTTLWDQPCRPSTGRPWRGLLHHRLQ